MLPRFLALSRDFFSAVSGQEPQVLPSFRLTWPIQRSNDMPLPRCSTHGRPHGYRIRLKQLFAAPFLLYQSRWVGIDSVHGVLNHANLISEGGRCVHARSQSCVGPR
jgi:hypothetical protein